jgi:hypothetical protein
MNTARVYKDSHGEDRTIFQMVRLEPEWAAHRIQEGEKAIARVTELEEMLRKKLDLIKCGIGGNYSGSPYENPLYTEVTALIENT